MTSNAQRLLLDEIAAALDGLPDEAGQQLLDYLRTLSRLQTAVPDSNALGADQHGRANWSKIAGTLSWPSDPLHWQEKLRGEWPDALNGTGPSGAGHAG